MTAAARVSIPDSVMVRQLGEESVMLDLASGTYFGLDPIGTRVWQLLAEGRSVAEAGAAIAGEYDVEPGQAESDVASLVKQLAEHGLLVAA